MATRIIKKEDLSYNTININTVNSGDFFESNNNLYIKLDNEVKGYNLILRKVEMFVFSAMVHEVGNCEIIYSKVHR